jgi:DNA-binding LacI/PurR family transcriptional regulator/serine phosphatase RsbU (regulator of sigma subunit)
MNPRSKAVWPANAGKRRVIGVLCDAVNEWYQNTIFLGVHDTVRDLGATVVLFCGGILASPHSVERERTALYDLIDASRVDGLIVVAPVADAVGPDALSAFCWRYAEIPVCTLAVELPGRPGVFVDNRGGMRDLVEHMLVAHGKRRVAFVRGPAASAEAEGRFEMYRAALQAHGIAFDPSLVVLGDFRAPSGAEAVRVLCDERRVAFDAVVAANDNMALGAMEALQARGIRVPAEVGVGGFDDMEEGRFATPPLTTVSQPIYESARQAARLLWAMLRHAVGAPRVTLSTRLVLRESCGCTPDEAAPSRGPARFAPAVSVAAHVADRRATVVATLARSVSPDQARIPPDWAEPLVDAFVADLADPRGQRLLDVFQATLRRVAAAGGSLRPWYAAVSVLRNASMGVDGDPAGIARACELLHRLRVLVGDMRERAQARHRIDREHWIRRLHEMSEALTRSFGEQALIDSVESQLPRWGIAAAVLALYDRDAPMPRMQARPLFVYDQGRRVPCEERAFPAHELAPNGWLDARRRTVVVEPLVFGGEQYGFALLEVGPHEGEVYEGMRRLLGSALKGADLVAQVVDAATERQRAERGRLEQEMEIAARIQTSLVLKTIDVPGLDVAAAMLPATEVGGDYYDVVPFDGGCWLGIGDVAGHGLPTGLVMLVIQSAVAALVVNDPDASPRNAAAIVNAVLFDSVRQRMRQDEHATLLLLRYSAGRIVYAGAHEEILVYRAEIGRCERIETFGPVFGAVPDVTATLAERAFDLARNDLLILYTDGLTDAMSAAGEFFGVERVCALVEGVADEPVGAVRDALFEGVRAWAPVFRDDVSVVVVRRTD